MGKYCNSIFRLSGRIILKCFQYLALFSLLLFLAACGKSDHRNNAQIFSAKSSDSAAIANYQLIPNFTHDSLILPDSLVNRSSYDLALKQYERANLFFRSTKNWKGVAHTLLKSTYALARKRDFISAQSHLAKATELFEKHLKIDLGLQAYIYHTQGILYDLMGKGKLAIKSHKISLKIKKRLWPNTLTNLIADSYSELGTVYRYNLYDYHKAELYYDSALTIRKEIYSENSKELLLCYYNLATTKRLKGDFYAALDMVKEAGAVLYHLQPIDSFFLSKYLNSKANIQFNLHLYDSAVFNYSEAIKVEQKIFSKANDLGIYLSNLSSSFLDLDDCLNAKKYLNRLYNLVVDHKGVKDTSLLMEYHYQLGAIFKNMGEFESSLESYKRCLLYRRSYYGSDHPEVFHALTEIGELYEVFNHNDMALDVYQQSLVEIIEGYHSEDIYAMPLKIEDKDLLSTFYGFENKARTMNKLFTEYPDSIELLTYSLECFNRANILVDRIRASYEQDGSKLLFAKDYQSFYQEALNTVFNLYQTDGNQDYLVRAFHFMERNKSILLQESIDRLMASKSIQRSEVRQKIISPKLVKHALPQSNFIEYFWGTQYLFVLSRYKGTYNFRKIKLHDELILAIDQFLQLVRSHPNPDSLKRNARNYSRLAYYLSKQLVLPELHHFSKKDLSAISVSEFIVVPDGKISQLPFEALLASPSEHENSNYQDFDYLLHHHNFRYAYSMNMMSQNTSFSSSRVSHVLAMGYTVQQKSSSFLPAIPFASEELKGIETHMKTTSFYEEEATLANFEKHSSDFDVLHIAVHGSSSTESPDSSRLIFFDDGSPTKYTLYLSDLYQMKMNAKLAVLSACETGIGKYYNGEGVYSIARGFFAAGCKASIISLWKIKDRPTANIMENFYKNFSLQKEAHIALNNAKRHYLKTAHRMNAHPSNWAAFIYLGKNVLAEKSKI